MTNSITPPPELVQEWIQQSTTAECTASQVATLAAQWGANQELEACCEEMKSLPSPLGIPFGEMASNALRAARRPSPKPPSLKEEASAAFEQIVRCCGDFNYFEKEVDTIRRALEALPND
jgi:hypothetical protein